MKRGQKASTPSSDKDREDEIEEESTIGNSTRQTLAFYHVLVTCRYTAMPCACFDGLWSLIDPPVQRGVRPHPELWEQEDKVDGLITSTHASQRRISSFSYKYIYSKGSCWVLDWSLLSTIASFQLLMVQNCWEEAMQRALQCVDEASIEALLESNGMKLIHFALLPEPCRIGSWWCWWCWWWSPLCGKFSA